MQAHAIAFLCSNPTNAMFHSFFSSAAASAASASSSSSYREPSFLSPVFCSAAAPHGLVSDANGCLPPFPSSIPSYTSSPSPYYLHRSSSTHSLPLRLRFPDALNPLPPPPPPLSSSPSSSSCDYFDFNAGPVRRVLSTGDLQGVNALHESYSQEGGAVAGRVGRYNAEERKERIERKTLADSRPRVRGRFARNGEMETETEVETETAGPSSFGCVGHHNYEQNQSCSVGGDWWSQFQAVLATDEEDESCYDEDLLASFADIFTMNNLS
ncbi:CCT motif [Musa troglodytarum]|uniref:CCT motif n=1 Tax=Musa troglodytarum TaxID=320322 RepID=A0A9E7FFM1_9LILI|nr:CCT motif [Musa troglodytarum]